MKLFRGYVATKDKACKEKFKDREDLKSYEDVQGLPEYAGILGQETILIDVDDFETSEVLFKIVKEEELKCRVYKTTRGKHFYFKNGQVAKNKTGCKLAIGLTADIKLGCSNSYAVLKFAGVDRPILYDCPEDEIQEVPKWLTPIATRMEFLDMGEGDGRNQALFNYILTLQSEDFTVGEARETISIINFYVLKNPMTDRELDVILRDDAFQKPIFFSGTKFLFDKFATYLKNNNHIVKVHGQLHIYKDGVYIPGSDDIEIAMIKNISKLNKTNRKEVLAYLNLIATHINGERNADLIAFNNGLLNWKTDELLPFDPDTVITNRIPWDYNPAAESDLVNKTLDKLACQNKEIRSLLEECAGYCFFRKNELGKAFILTGDGANGKSTFIDMVKAMLGEDNISALDMRELGEKFKTTELVGKLANLGDDIGEEFIANPSVFKKLVTGNTINVEKKGETPFDFNPYAKMLFSANTIPRIKDKTDGLTRRLVIVPFDAKFTDKDEDYDPWIKDKLITQEAIEYLILVAIKGLKRVIMNQRFTASAKVKEALDDYEMENNSIVSFMMDYGVANLEYEPTRSIYQKYVEFCHMNGLKEAYSNVSFTLQVKKRYGYEVEDKKINGEKCRIFVRKKAAS